MLEVVGSSPTSSIGCHFAAQAVTRIKRSGCLSYECPAPADTAYRLPRARLSRSALDLVVNTSHHRLVNLNTRHREDRQKGYPKCLKCLPRLPNVEDLDLAVRLKSDVGDTSLRGSGTRFLKLDERRVVPLLRKALGSDVEPECHSIPTPFAQSARWFVQRWSRTVLLGATSHLQLRTHAP